MKNTLRTDTHTAHTQHSLFDQSDNPVISEDDHYLRYCKDLRDAGIIVGITLVAVSVPAVLAFTLLW